jgi:RNA 2',3'-cyclic 3'-phosphodiesterase
VGRLVRGTPSTGRLSGGQCGVRLFVAVWPPEDVIDLVGALSRPEEDRVRWTTPDQWHVTLRFLGEVSEVERVADALNGPRGLGGTGVAHAVLGPVSAWFPGKRVLQVPVSGLEALAKRVALALEPVTDVLPKARENETGPYFRGHLTLARVRGQERLSSGVASQLSGAPIAAEWQVDSISLVASRTLPSGSSYTDVAAVDL